MHSKHIATLDHVYNIPVPARTHSWDPVSHREIIELVDAEIPKHNLTITNWNHTLARKDQQYFGLVTVTDNTGMLETGGASLQIGVRNSINKSIAAGLVAGTRVMVCSNLSFYGDVALSRKHTSNIRADLGNKITSAFHKLLNLFGKQKDNIDQFRSREIDQAEVDALLLRSLREGVLPPSKFEAFEKQWRSYDDPVACGGESQPTAWRFFNAVTQVIKDSNPSLIAARTGHLFTILNELNAPVLDWESDAIGAGA